MVFVLEEGRSMDSVNEEKGITIVVGIEGL
jgi:hypothetical protein